MTKDEVNKELKQIKKVLPDGIDVMIDNGKIRIFHKTKEIIKIAFDKDYNPIIKTDKIIYRDNK